MAIQNITDLSKDQENERYSRLKKSLPKLAAASLAIALAVYFSYSSSPWRYVPIVVLASAAVLLIAGAIMKHSVKTEESMHQAKSPKIKQPLLDTKWVQECQKQPQFKVGFTIRTEVIEQPLLDIKPIQEYNQPWVQKWKPEWHDSSNTVKKDLIKKVLNFDEASSFQKRLIDMPQVVETNLLHNDIPQIKLALPSSFSEVDKVPNALEKPNVNKALGSHLLGG